MISIMCCNVIQAGVVFEIAPRKKTVSVVMCAGLDFKREIICYLKSCTQCGGARITVFAECSDGMIYFIERIKSRNIGDFLRKNRILRRLKCFAGGQKGVKYIPLKYFDKGKQLACTVGYSSLKVAPYDTDVLAGLKGFSCYK